MFNKGGVGNLMKQAQQMQANMQRLQDEIAATEIEGNAQGVKVIISGKHQVKRIHLDEAVMDDREMLEDLLVLALNDANNRLEALSQEKMGKATSGMGLPPGFKLPF